jgi:hypothetical protein
MRDSLLDSDLNSAQDSEALNGEVEQCRIVNLGQDLAHIDDEFCNNRIVTAKYTWLNFVPKFLMEEFSKEANVYFLVVCVLQFIPAISNGDNTLVLILLFIIFVDAIFQLNADFERHRDDSEANGRLCRVFDRGLGRLVDRRWDEVVTFLLFKAPHACSPNHLCIADQSGGCSRATES